MPVAFSSASVPSQKFEPEGDEFLVALSVAPPSKRKPGTLRLPAISFYGTPEGTRTPDLLIRRTKTGLKYRIKSF